MTQIKSQLLNTSKLFIGLTIVVSCVVLLAYVISEISINVSSWLSLDGDPSTLIDLSINSLLVSVTTMYVLATYKMLKETEQSIDQNKEIIKFNTRIHNLSRIQDQLENFYYPLNDLLNSQFGITETKDRINGNQNTIPVIRIRVDFKDAETKKSTGFADIINHQYLAKEGTKQLLNQFLTKIYNSASSTDSKLIELYNNLNSAVIEDIKKLNEEYKNT
jgi:uncharacterized membrane protein